MARDQIPSRGLDKSAASSDSESCSRIVEPWATRKSKRGPKKVLDTEGAQRAWPNLACDYVGIGDSALHAIVGGGKRDMTDDISYCAVSTVVDASAVDSARRCYT